MRVVSVVAGGWSVKDVPLDTIPGTIIAINDSAFHLPRYDICVSMDRLWTEHRWDFLRKQRRLTYLRRSAAQNCPHKGLPWCHIFENDNAPGVQLSDHDAVLNGTNSGACGINLAYILRPQVVYLYGFDMRRNKAGAKYWYPPYPWKYTTSDARYATWADEFSMIDAVFREAGIPVFNVSPGSAVRTFPRIAHHDVEKKTRELAA